MPKDARFTLPPEDIDKLSKGKGKQVETATTSNKRKRSAKNSDNDDDEGDLYDQVLNGPLPSTSKSKLAAEPELENVDNDDEEPLNTLPKPLQIDSIASYNATVDRSGIIYISRIPPGMGPSKVKHILSNYGEIGRIYLVAADSSSSSSSKRDSGKKHKPHRFVEGWVEFLDKKIARSTAEALNAQIIGDMAISKGSKKNGGSKKWKDDVWTMKYLPRFKWNMLSEQVAIEAATRQALLRNELANSKKEQAEYLRQVERAKNHEKAQEKKRVRLERRVGDNDGASSTTGGEKSEKKKGREFEQKESVHTAGKGVDEKLGKVLDSLF